MVDWGRSSYFYVATAYTNWPGTRQEAFDHAVWALSKLLAQGIPAFAPIVHTHPVEAAGLVRDHKFWMDVDRPFMRAACGLIVVCSSTWQQSKGIAEEIQTFLSARKPIYYWHYLDGQVLPADRLIKEAQL